MEKSWCPFVGPAYHPNHTLENRTIDVLRKNCFWDFDTVACARSSVLCVACGVTAVVCVARLLKFHLLRGQRHYHHLTLFYLAFIHCLTGAMEWVLGWTSEASLACMYLRSLELLIVCHFYLTLASRVLHCDSDQSSRLAVLSMSALFVYFTAFIVIGLVSADSPWFDCFASHWLWLSGGHLLAVQLIVVASVILCRKINTVSVQPSLKRAQKRDLCCLTASFEISAGASLSYHLSLFLLANQEIGCSGVFNHQQSFYSLVKVPYEVLVFLLPIWAIIWVFRPSSTPQYQLVEEPSQHSSISSVSEGVLLDPTLVPSATVRNWRHRYRPLNPRLVQPGGIPYRRLTTASPRLRPLSAGMRRTASAPTSLISGRRRARGYSFPFTPPPVLASIPEESRSRTSSQGSPDSSSPPAIHTLIEASGNFSSA